MVIREERQLVPEIGIGNPENGVVINPSVLSAKLENFVSAMQRFASLPDIIQPVCTGVLSLATQYGGVHNFRSVPNAENRNDIIFAVPGGASVNIYAVSEDQEWALINLPLQDDGRRARNPEGRSPQTISPRAFGWVASDSLVSHTCGDLQSINQGIINPDYIPTVNPPDYTGFYFDAWEGLQLALEYAASDPEGWWGEDGLDYWELTAWIMNHEVLHSVLPNIPEREREAVIRQLAEGVYFRYRQSVEQANEPNVSGPYEPWYQFFGGFIPPRWYGIIIPPDFDPTDIESIEAFWEALGEPQGGNELGDEQRRSFLKFIMSGDRYIQRIGEDKPDFGIPLPYYNNTLDALNDLQEIYGDVPFEEMRQSLQGAIYFWTWSEIVCDKRSEFDNPDASSKKLFEGRYFIKDKWMFFGTIEQFEYAGVGGGVKGC